MITPASLGQCRWNGMRVLTTALRVPTTTSGRRSSLFFSSGIFELGFSRFPSAYAREVLPRQVLARGDLGCKEKHWRTSSTVVHVSCLSESRGAKFSKKAEFLDFLRTNRDGQRKERSRAVFCSDQPTRKRMSRMVLPPKRCFSFRRISDLEICSSS